MSTSPFERPVEPGDFDIHAFKPPILEGMTIEVCRTMPVGEKMRRVSAAFGEVRAGHRRWYLERYPGACEVEIWGDWLRVTECSPILAKAMRDPAERDADEPFFVFGCQENV